MLCVVGLTAALARDVLPFVALARDDGRYADAPLKSWFDRLASGKGLCCSFADGAQVDDVDWDTVCERVGLERSRPLPDGSRREQTENCRYRVRLHGECTDGRLGCRHLRNGSERFFAWSFAWFCLGHAALSADPRPAKRPQGIDLESQKQSP
jgi:hypothetical protein